MSRWQDGGKNWTVCVYGTYSFNHKTELAAMQKEVELIDKLLMKLKGDKEEIKEVMKEEIEKL